MPGRFRDAVERRSIVMLTYLNTLPRAVPFGLVALLLLAGLLTTGLAAFTALIILTAILTWLLYIGWPHMAPGPRMLRLAVTLLVAGSAVRALLA